MSRCCAPARADGGIENVGVANLLDAPDGIFGLEPVDEGLHGRVRGTIPLQETTLESRGPTPGPFDQSASITCISSFVSLGSAIGLLLMSLDLLQCSFPVDACNRDSGRRRVLSAVLPFGGLMKAIWQLASLGVCFVALSGLRRHQIAAQSTQARGQFERYLTVNGPVDLSIRTGSGSIQIRTGAVDRVQITGRICVQLVARRRRAGGARASRRNDAADRADRQRH